MNICISEWSRQCIKFEKARRKKKKKKATKEKVEHLYMVSAVWWWKYAVELNI